MKKGIALLLTAAFSLTSFVNVQAADTQDKGLEKAITNAKTIFDIPKEYSKFDYTVNSNNGENIWRLVWSTPKDNKNRGQLTIQIDDEGFVSNYDKYSSNEDYHNEGRIPKYSRQSAEENAKKFIEKLNPGLTEKLESDSNNDRYLDSKRYSFYYHLVQNGIPYYNFRCWVSVNGDTGEINNYSAGKISNLTFPDKKGVLAKEDAEKIIKDKKGIELTYLQSYSDDNIKVYPAYIITSNGGKRYDAFTGEVLENYDRFGITNYDQKNSLADSVMYAGSAAKSESKVSLTQEELDAVKQMTDILSKDDAEKIARAIPEMGLDNDFKISGFSMNKNRKNKDQYVWNLTFQKDKKQNEKEVEYERNYASVSINAVTGKVINFYVGYGNNEKNENTISISNAKAAAEAFAKKLEPEKFGQVEFNEEYSTKEILADPKPEYTSYTFTYRRLVNGIPCKDDNIRIVIDAKTGKVLGYSVDWYDGQFPTVDKAISLDEAYKILFNELGVKLSYVNYYPLNDKTLIPNPENTVKPEIKLIYSVDSRKSSAIDANTGKLLDSQGRPYVENSIKPYTDVSGHYAEQAIRVLQEFGVGFDTEKFLPDQNITQAEFLTIVYKTKDNYFTQYTDKDKQQDFIYQNLLRLNVIKENEIAPDSKLTKEDAVKFIIRSMNFEKVAQIKNIFICDFNDKDEISKDLIGYVTIAKGLGIVSGYNGYFVPKATLTRAEASILIYNSLK